MKKREKEEKSFIDANDYVLVCKKLKEVRAELELCIQELQTYKTQCDTLSTKYNEIIVDNENQTRRAETANKMVDQLNAQKIDIQYKAEKMMQK